MGRRFDTKLPAAAIVGNRRPNLNRLLVSGAVQVPPVPGGRAPFAHRK